MKLINGLKKMCLGLLILSSFYGCHSVALIGLGAAAGIGAYAIINGKVERKYPASFQESWQACIEAMENLEFETTEWNKDALSGWIKGQRADGTSIRISLERLESRVTSIKIRVGSFGEKDVSRQIHEAIENNLFPNQANHE